MNRSMKLATSFILFIILCGCNYINKHHPVIESRYLPDNSIPKLNATHAVTLKNISTIKEETRLCGISKQEWWGNLYDITDKTIAIAKNALQINNITIDDKADKILALSVTRFTCEPGWNDTKFSTTLQVRTGNGIEKEYIGLSKNATGWQMTIGFEEGMAKCVELMLNDKEILDYLEH